jgi:hypothetical protein
MNRIASFDLEGLLEVVNLIAERNKYPFMPADYPGTKKKYICDRIFESINTLVQDRKKTAGDYISTMGYIVRITDVFDPKEINYKGNQIVAIEVNYTACSADMNFVYYDGITIWKDIEEELENELGS